jgi:hypothetical protein
VDLRFSFAVKGSECYFDWRVADRRTLAEGRIDSDSATRAASEAVKPKS